MERTTLKGICSELKIDPRVAREKLRGAIREPKKYPNLANRGNGQRAHPLRRKPARRSRREYRIKLKAAKFRTRGIGNPGNVANQWHWQCCQDCQLIPTAFISDRRAPS